MTPTPRCKHCGLTEEEITGACAMHSRGTHEVIVITSDFDSLPQISGNAEEEAFDAAVFAPPAPPADPLMRALWDLENVVESAPALEPVSICTRAAAIAAVHQAIWLRDISHALEDIAHSLAREQFGIPEPIKNYGDPGFCPHTEGGDGGILIRCGRAAGHDGPHKDGVHQFAPRPAPRGIRPYEPGPHPEPPPCPTAKEPGPPWYSAKCKLWAGHTEPCDFGTKEQACAAAWSALLAASWKEGAE